MKCPRCGLINPDTAQICDCGYDFDTQKVAYSRSSQDSPRKMESIATENQRYKTLLAFGKFFSFIGWVVVVIGGIIFFVGLSQLGQRNIFGGSSPIGTMGLLSGLLVSIYGIMLVASGQGISCFVSIENNTHATMLAQQAMLNMMRKSKGNETAAAASGIAAKTLRSVKKTEEFSEKIEKPELSSKESEEDEELEFCYHCGAKLTEKTKKCPECGKPL